MTDPLQLLVRTAIAPSIPIQYPCLMLFDTNVLIRLQNVTDLQRIADQSLEEPVVVFKHSATCPVSAWARNEISAFVRDTGRPVYEVVVQCSRPLSNVIAEQYGIRHESPQVIVLFKGRPQFHASHRRVTSGAVQAAVQQASTEDAPAPTPVPG